MCADNCIDTLRGMRSPDADTISLSWRDWLRDGRRLVGFEIQRALGLVKIWRMRIRMRRALAGLDAHLLQDIGISRAAAFSESRKPFWHGTDYVG